MHSIDHGVPKSVGRVPAVAVVEFEIDGFWRLLEKLLGPLPPHCGLVSVLDGHPATLGWMGGVMGHRMCALGVEHFGQTGTLPDLYRTYRIDAAAIVEAAHSLHARLSRPRIEWSR